MKKAIYITLLIALSVFTELSADPGPKKGKIFAYKSKINNKVYSKGSHFIHREPGTLFPRHASIVSIKVKNGSIKVMYRYSSLDETFTIRDFEKAIKDGLIDRVISKK